MTLAVTLAVLALVVAVVLEAYLVVLAVAYLEVVDEVLCDMSYYCYADRCCDYYGDIYCDIVYS